MFEGWASDLLASYLGQFLEVQREQLRISLWSAWRTGLTMQNVAFRPGAFDHMQLPFKLSHGQIGTLQIHVPWRALRSPVVIDLTNVELTLSLLTPEDLAPEASAERAWAVKQAHLAAQELQELAAGVSSNSEGKPPPEAKQGGMLWSLVQHAVTMLLRRLQLSVTNVHVRVVDPTTGRYFGFKLGKLHTCLPGETEHQSLLLAEDAGVAVHSSTAARGSIQKQIAAQGIQFYWKIGNRFSNDNSSSSSSPLEQESSRIEDDVDKDGQAAAPSPLSVERHLLPPLQSTLPLLTENDGDENWNVLHSTDIVVHVTSKIIGSGPSDPIKVHASAIVHSIPVAIRPCQIKDILHCMDEMNWTSARAKHAELRPASARDWRSMWRYAVNAVLADVKGPLKAAPWRPPSQIQHDRQQYVLLYRKKLEAERELLKKTEESATAVVATGAGSADVSSSSRPSSAETGNSTSQQQEQQHAQQASSSAVPIRIGLSPVGEKRLLEFERLLCVQDILTCRSAAAHSLIDGTGSGTNTSSTSEFTGVKKGSTVGGMSDEESARSGVFWGIAKAASFVGYGGGGGGGGGGVTSSSSCSSAATKASASASALLPRPTASDVRELYEAVDFHPEEEKREKINEGEEEGQEDIEEKRSSDAGAGTGAVTRVSKKDFSSSSSSSSWLELSVNCLLSEAKLTLKSNDTGAPLAAICLQGLQTEIRLGGGDGDGSGDSTGLTAEVTLKNLYGLDYTSCSTITASGSTIGHEEVEEAEKDNDSVIFLGRGPTNEQQQQQNGTNNANSTNTTTSSSSPSAGTMRPVVRLHYTANASKLDVLVQPIRLRLHPVLLQTFVQFIPPAIQGSYVGSCMAALNALSETSRAAYKAERLQKLGPPLDLVAKIVDFELLLVGSSTGGGATGGARGGSDDSDLPQTTDQQSSNAGGILLRTGAVVLHSVGQAATFKSAEPIFKVLGRIRDVMLGEGREERASSTARNELGSAVATVEQQLVYQHIDFDIAAVQILAISCFLPASESSSTSSSFSPEIEILSNFLLFSGPNHEAPVVAPAPPPSAVSTDVVSVLLHPTKLSGTIKSHRLALDFGVPQLLLRLALDPIKADVQYEHVKIIIDIMESGGGSKENNYSVSSPPPVQPPPQPPAPVTLPPYPHPAGPVQTVIDLSLTSIDITYDDTGGFTSHFALKKGNLNFQSYAPHVAGGTGEVGLKLSLDSLLLEDSSSHPSVACALPAVLSPVYRLGKEVFIGSAVVEVVPMLEVDGVKAIEVHLEDVVLDGFNEEPGNFIARNNEKDPTSLSVSITDSLHLHRTAVIVTNVSLGHSTILRILAVIFGPSEIDQEQPPKQGEHEESAAITAAVASPPPPPPPPLVKLPLPSPSNPATPEVPTTPIPPTSESNIKRSEIAIDLYDCCLVCRYQDPLPGSNIFVPGQVQDYFCVLKDMFVIELPRMSLNLPFLLENVDQVDHGAGVEATRVPVLTLENAELIMATTGVPGYYTLPMVHLPSLLIERELVECSSSTSTSQSTSSVGEEWCQVLKMDAPIVELGVHPSHLIIGTLAMQLLQEEFITLLGGRIGSDGGTSKRGRTPAPSKTPGNSRAAAFDLETPRQLVESEEDSEDFLSPPAGQLFSPPLPAQSSPLPSPASFGATGTVATEPAAPKILWRLETTVGLLSLSLLGSLTTSTCLKFEWHQLLSSMSNIPCAAVAASSSSLQRNSDESNEASLPSSMTTTLAWSYLSVHVLRPKDTGELMESFTPFHGMSNGIFSTPNFGAGFGDGLGPGPTRPGSVTSGAGGEGAALGGDKTSGGLNPLVPSGTPPSQIVPGIASAAGAGMKRRNSSFFSASGGVGGGPFDQEESQETAVSAGAFSDKPLADQDEGNLSKNQRQEQQDSSPLVDASMDYSASGTPSFTDARSVMLSRFSGSGGGGGGGGSIVSRHFSVHDSELYEDAASELFLPDGSIRSPDGRSPRQQKPLLPLDLSSSEFEVDLLVKLVSTTLSSTSSPAAETAGQASTGANANVVFTQHAQHTKLALESLNLRVYLHGWQHVVECVQNYEDFQVQAVGRVAEAGAGWKQLGELLSSGQKSSSEEISPSAANTVNAAATDGGDQVHLRLQANQLVIEAVAAAGRHSADQEQQNHSNDQPLSTSRTTATARNNNHSTTPSPSSSRIVPAGQIVLQLSGEIQRGPDGARFMVSVPAALLRVGPIHLDESIGDIYHYNTSSNHGNGNISNDFIGSSGSSSYDASVPLVFGPGDALLGLKNAEITASSETFEFETYSREAGLAIGVSSAAAAAAGVTATAAPLKTRRSLDALAISLQHASVWAGQRNLCCAAALGQHVAYMVAEVISLQKALASQQQQHHRHHHHHHHPRQQSPEQHYMQHRFDVGLDNDGLTLSGGVASDGVIATGIDTGAAGAASAGSRAVPVAPYTEHHTAINVEIDSIAIALQCERLEDSKDLASTNNRSSGGGAAGVAGGGGDATKTEVSPSPLFELALSKISIQSTDRGDGGSSGTAMLQIGLDVYNGSKLAWEPVVDPWGACLHFTVPKLSPSSSNAATATASRLLDVTSTGVPYAAHASSGMYSTSRHLKLEVVSNQNFEATVTAAVTDAAAAAGAILSHIPAVIDEPDTLKEHILPDNSLAAAAALPVTFQLNNLTGSDVEIWLEAPLPGGLLPSRPPVGPPTMCLSTSGRAVLPVLPLYHGSAWRSRRAGKPSFLGGVEFDKNGLVDGEKEDEDSEMQNNSIRQRRTLLYFRFSGQQGPLSGPVFLNKPGAVSYSVHVGNPYESQVSSLLSATATKTAAADSLGTPSTAAALLSAQVVAETSERRHGSFTAVLHSGVCISNTTPIDLDIGITYTLAAGSGVNTGASAAGGGGSGGAEEPLSLGVLPSGESTWLPAAEAEMGLLHVRPTATYRPPIIERMPQSARSLPPLPTRHPSAAAVAAAVAAGAGVSGGGIGIGLSSGVHPPASVSSDRSSGVVYRSGAGSTINNTQPHSAGAGTAFGTGGATTTTTTTTANGHLFKWSAGLSLSQLIKQQQGSSRGGVGVGRGADGEGSGHGGVATATIKHLSCAPTNTNSSLDSSPMLLTVGATLQGMSWNLSFAPPFTVHNALPVPVDIIITPKRGSTHFSTTTTSFMVTSATTAYPLRLHLLPNDRAPMLHLNAAQVESVSVRPEGFEMTSPLPINEKSKAHGGHPHFSVPPPPPPPAGVPVSVSEADLAGAWQFHSYSGIGGGNTSTSSNSGDGGDDSISLAGLLLDTAGSTGAGGLGGENPQQLLLPLGAETVATVQELPPGRSTVDFTMQHALSIATGSHLFRLSCGMWIYNCIGVPLSIRNASLEDSLMAEAGSLALDTSEQDLLMLSIDDHVPDSWVPPLLMPPDSTSPDAVDHHPNDGLSSRTYYGDQSGGDAVLYRTGTGASPLSTYRTGVGSRGGGGGELRTPRPGMASARTTDGIGNGGVGRLVSARTAPPGGGLTGRSLPSISGSMMSAGRTPSAADVPGLSEILDSGAGGGGGGLGGGFGAGGGGGGHSTARSGGISPSPLSTGRSSVLGYQQRPLSRARGIADSMDSSPTFERPSAWPSMASGLSHGASHRLRLQLRSAATKAPLGRTFWSPTVDLDASGGAVVTSIPSPAPAAAVAAAAAGTAPSASALRGSYPVVVTSTQVPSADGVLALCISPQFVLRNALHMPIQYKQQGSIAGEREVPPGGVRAIRWADDALPPRLCVRVQEAGWIWSGGFQLDVPGDIFVKSRHRDRGITMLLRVDVAISDSGSAQITLSHNPAGFAPYRVENCSTETLHARQKSVREQQDVLRPYCALNYAWDEPTQPHILVLELPGARNLGAFDLDKVGQDKILSFSTPHDEPDKALRVIVRAEGPTRVLTVIDEKVHVMHPLPSRKNAAATSTAPGRDFTPRPTTAPAALLAKQQQQSKLSITHHPASDLSLPGPLWEIIVDLSSVGISLVSSTHEVAYLRLTGARVTVAEGAARQSYGLTVKGIQLDNPSPWVAFPVTLVLPAPVSRLGSSMAAAVEITPAPALQVLLSLWQRKPAGVLCVEVAQFQMESVAVYLDQQHLEEVAAVVGTVMQGPGGNGNGTTAAAIGPGAASGVGEGLASQSFMHATRASSSLVASTIRGIEPVVLPQQPDTVLGSSRNGGAEQNNDGTDIRGQQQEQEGDVVTSTGGARTRVTSSVDLDVLLTTTAPESLATSGRQTPTFGGLGEERGSSSPAASTRVVEEGVGENNNTWNTSILPPTTSTTTTTSPFPTMPRLPLQNLAALQAVAGTPRVGIDTARTPASLTTRTTPHPTGYGVATVLAPAAAAMALQGIATDLAASSSWRRRKIYMDTLSIAPIEVTLSFLSSPVHHYVASHPRLAALQRLLSLADVEDARVWLAGLNLSNPLMDVEALRQALQKHYLRSLVPELYKLVGAASVIGDPVSLLQHLGAGVWTFVSAPAEGLLASARALGPRQFLLGVLRGTQGLLLNVVFAISNATTKAAGAARKAIVVWGLDRQDEPLGAGSFRRRVMFIEGGGLGRGYDGEGEDALLSAVLRGLAGLISEPIRGVEEAGLVGLIKGLQRGALRAVALPLAVLLEMSARFADSVRRAVAGSSNLGWLRPPRHVSPSEALAPYDWSSAMGRWLLTELQTVEAHAAARRREKLAANHHHYHYHLNLHGGNASGRASVVSNENTSSHGSGSLGVREEYNSSGGGGSGSGSALGASSTPFGHVNASSFSSSPSTSPAVTVETFLLCVPTGIATTAAAAQKHNACYLILTSRRVLYVRAKGLMWEPDVQWQGSMCDLELVSHVDGETAVRFVAHPPPLKVAAAPLSLLSAAAAGSGSPGGGLGVGGGGGKKTGQTLFSFLRVDCEDAGIAEKVKIVTQKSMKAAAAVPRGGLLL